MIKLDRYIVRSVLTAVSLVLVVVISLDLVFGFLAEMEDAKNDYGAWQAIQFVVTTMPRRIYDYLPLAAFMGSLIGLGMLANTSELVIMRAAGLSTWRIVWSAMKPAILVVLVGLVLGEYVAPYTEQIAQNRKSIALSGEERLATKRGVWLREGDDYIHINAVETGGGLQGITVYRFGESTWLESIMHAHHAETLDGAWWLKDVAITTITPGRISTSSAESVEWDTGLTVDLVGLLSIKPDNLSISGLYGYANYLIEQGINANQYLMSLWKKALRPVTTMVLVLVAISFVFGPLRSVTMGFRVFIGILLGLVFKYAQDLLGPSSLVFGFNPVWATLTPIAICAVTGFLLMRRAG